MLAQASAAEWFCFSVTPVSASFAASHAVFAAPSTCETVFVVT
jgi:hypothetical protein